MAPDADKTPTPSIYLEEPFKRQGLFYFDLGLTFATVSYQGGLVGKPKPPTQQKPQPGKPRQVQVAPEQPLTKAYLELYGVDWQGYGRIGLTPRYLPDLFFTVGLGIQTAAGRLSMFAQKYQHFVIQPDAYVELELVVLRVKTGALSGFVGQDQGLLPGGANFGDDRPPGTRLNNFRLALRTASSGIRLLFPF